MLLLLAPLFIVIAATIKLESPGGVLYRCRRVGRGGRELQMLKFRKMHEGARGPALVQTKDERFTRLGAFLARTKLDELPQLWNVLKGEMSLVGPRPEDPSFVEQHREAYDAILAVRPGITGLSQLAFARETEVLDPSDPVGHYVSRILPQKMQMDRMYAVQRSFSMDLKILWWTLSAVVARREVAVHRDTGRLSRRAPREPAPEVAAHAVTREAGLLMATRSDELSAVRRRRRARANGKGNLGEIKTVVLAGGRGTRLAPYTSILPKPLMPVGDQSILEVVVGQLEEAGIVDIHFCVGYLAHLVEAVFDNRKNGHVKITYVREQEALGTAAPLRLVEGLDSTFLVMNGDVLTTLDYRELVKYHREQGNVLTIATHKRSIKIDYGMMHLDVTSRVRAFEEKPEIVSPVSMGIYVMEPEALDSIPAGTYFDFPDLVQALLAEERRVGAYLYDGLWFDIGRQEDYERAIDAWTKNGEEKVNENGKSARSQTKDAAQR